MSNRTTETTSNRRTTTVENNPVADLIHLLAQRLARRLKVEQSTGQRDDRTQPRENAARSMLRRPRSNENG